MHAARFCLGLLIATSAWADVAEDRAAIIRTIAALNGPSRHLEVFTTDANAAAELDRLRQPTVKISHEPWGEAEILWNAVVINQRIASGGIRFLSADVALVEGKLTDQENNTKPLLFVMKKDDGKWKIASLRVLASR
jgi:hypothetical protein